MCILGEHTDYNDGLALSIAITQKITVNARRSKPDADGTEWVTAQAADLKERDKFALSEPGPPGAQRGWRAFVRGVTAELARAGLRPVGARLRIAGDMPRGAGMSSSAALEVALSLALLELAGTRQSIDRTELAKLCSKVENDWVGAHTGLLDQLSSLYGKAYEAMLIDFRAVSVEHVPLHLHGWRLVVYDTGERRENASSGYNERRSECAQACALLGVSSLREVSPEQANELPEPLRARAEHVLGDNHRVERAVAALQANDLATLAKLLNESHASLRDLMAISTPTVDAAVARMRNAGAAGARILGGGFGGSVLALLPPLVDVPEGARQVQPCAGARIVEE